MHCMSVIVWVGLETWVPTVGAGRIGDTKHKVVG